MKVTLNALLTFHQLLFLDSRILIKVLEDRRIVIYVFDKNLHLSGIVIHAVESSHSQIVFRDLLVIQRLLHADLSSCVFDIKAVVGIAKYNAVGNRTGSVQIIGLHFGDRRVDIGIFQDRIRGIHSLREMGSVVVLIRDLDAKHLLTFVVLPRLEQRTGRIVHGDHLHVVRVFGLSIERGQSGDVTGILIDSEKIPEVIQFVRDLEKHEGVKRRECSDGCTRL